MLLVSCALLLQAPLTVGGFVDETTRRLGYGAVGTSVSQATLIAFPDPGNAVDVDVRLKNRWRVVRDKTMPGVFRSEAVPYPDAFEETGAGVPYYTTRGGNDPAPRTVRPGPQAEPLPKVERDDLFRPRGVRVTMGRLAELLEVKDALPWVFLRRSATVRLDPARMPEPLSLLAAIVGAEVVPDQNEPGRKVVAFDPVVFRRVVVATLREEAKRGPRPVVGVVSGRVGEFAAYEKERPVWLELGALAHERATDAQLIELYQAPDRTLAIEGMSLTQDLLAFAEGRFQRLRPRLEPEVSAGFDRVSKVQVTLSNVRGTGTIGVWSRNGETILDLGDVGDFGRVGG